MLRFKRETLLFLAIFNVQQEKNGLASDIFWNNFYAFLTLGTIFQQNFS